MNQQAVANALNLFLKQVAAEVDPVMIAMMEHRMFSLRHGYLAHNEPLVNHVNFNTQLKDCYHPWTADAFGHTFGVREYDKVIDLYNYMHLPIDSMEDLLEGVIRGQADLVKLKKAAADKAARAAGGDVDPVKSALINATREDKRHG